MRLQGRTFHVDGTLTELVSLWRLPGPAVAYLGDAPRDMEMARDAGVLPLGAAWCSTPPPRRFGQRGLRWCLPHLHRCVVGWREPYAYFPL